MKTKITLFKSIVFFVALLVSTSCFSWYADSHYGGSYYRGGGWGGWGVAVPLGGYSGAGYYGPTCYNQRVCDYKGCWMEQKCY